MRACFVGVRPVDAILAALVAALPYNRRAPVCRTAEYCPGLAEVLVTFERIEPMLPRRCKLGGSAVDRAVFTSIDERRLARSQYANIYTRSGYLLGSSQSRGGSSL